MNKHRTSSLLLFIKLNAVRCSFPRQSSSQQVFISRKTLYQKIIATNIINKRNRVYKQRNIHMSEMERETKKNNIWETTWSQMRNIFFSSDPFAIRTYIASMKCITRQTLRCNELSQQWTNIIRKNNNNKCDGRSFSSNNSTTEINTHRSEFLMQKGR